MKFSSPKLNGTSIFYTWILFFTQNLSSFRDIREKYSSSVINSLTRWKTKSLTLYTISFWCFMKLRRWTRTIISSKHLTKHIISILPFPNFLKLSKLTKRRTFDSSFYRPILCHSRSVPKSRVILFWWSHVRFSREACSRLCDYYFPQAYQIKHIDDS